MVAAAFYAFFVVLAPFAHHDLDCELKNPLHCTACASSHVGSDPNPPAPLGVNRLADAGLANADLLVPADLLLAVRSTGRSPPASV